MRHGEVAIFGAGGFVGRWLVAELAGRAADGVRTWPGEARDSIDITDRQAVVDFLREHQPGSIVNLAAIASPREARSAPATAWAVNFSAAMMVAEAILEHSPQTRLVQIGSSEAYGESFGRAGGRVDEDMPLRPMTAYGATKAAADMALGQLVHEGLKLVRFRPFNHTGPGQTPSYVVPAFARQVARIGAGLQPPTLEVGNLRPVRDFMDVRDVVRAYADAATSEADGLEGGIFNLASGEGTSIGDLLRQMLELAGVAAEVVPRAEAVRPNEVARAVGDASRAARVLGWQPRISLAQTLTDVLEDWARRVKDEQA